MRKLFAVLGVALFIVGSAIAQTPAAVGKEQVLDKWAQALGGREKLLSIRTQHSRASIEMGGLKGSDEIWSDSSGRHREDSIVGPDASTVVFDGQHAWTRDKVGKVHPLSGAELEDEVTNAYFESLAQFFPDRRKGTVEYLGEDANAYKLRIAVEGGRTVTEYLDKQSGLPIKEERPSQERISTIYFLDWKDWGGIKTWWHARQSTGDPKFDVTAINEQVEWNPPLESSMFTRPQPGPPDFHFARGDSSAGIPIEISSNHIYVPVRINDKGPYAFVFDTGADVTVLNSDVAKQLGLKSEGALEARGSGEQSAETGMIPNVTFGLPGVTMTPRPTYSIPLTPLEPRVGRRIDGIIGYDIISSFVVEVDYAAGRISFFDPRTYRYTGHGTVVPIQFTGNTPLIHATVVLPDGEALPIRLEVDTGDRSPFDVNAPYVTRHGLLEKLKNIRAPGGFGVGGAAKELISRVPELRVESIAFKDIVTNLSQDAKGSGANPEVDGLFGGGAMRRCKVIFDYANERMILEPGPDFNQPFEYDMSGLLLVSDPPDFKSVRVEEVVPGSAGDEAGIRVKDELMALDGKAITQYSMDQLKELFRQPGREYKLTIRREGRESDVLLKTRRMI